MKKSLFLSHILDKTCQLHKGQFAFPCHKRGIFLLCVFLAEGEDIVFSHRAVSAEERLLTSSSATTASWAKNEIHCPLYQQQKTRFTSHRIPFIIIITGQELTRPQIIIYWQITGSRVHDRVYMWSLRHPGLFFCTREPSWVFVCSGFFDIHTLNIHSIMITNTSDDMSLNNKTVISYKKV